jgi:hypothetical protein
MNRREAIIIRTDTKAPILDLDPIMLETDVDRELANAFADEVMRTWETVVDFELAAFGDLSLSVVWSDTGARVQFLCPLCDDQCDLDDGATEDLSDNRCAMVCSSCLD